MAKLQRVSVCLWFDGNAEEAAQFYTKVFDNSKINRVSCYPDAGKEIHGREPGSVATVDFELDGQRFMGLNGGPQFKFSEAVSLVVRCESQAEIDRYWQALQANGGAEVECGWLKDRFGLSWQIVPDELDEMISDPDVQRVSRVFNAVWGMKKLDLAKLRHAYEGR